MTAMVFVELLWSHDNREHCDTCVRTVWMSRKL